VEDLQRHEAAPGQWTLGGTRLPFGDELQKLFPWVGRFVDLHGSPAVSRLSPEQVATAIEETFGG
jgi:hypothetical protein